MLDQQSARRAGLWHRLRPSVRRVFIQNWCYAYWKRSVVPWSHNICCRHWHRLLRRHVLHRVSQVQRLRRHRRGRGIRQSHERDYHEHGWRHTHSRAGCRRRDLPHQRSDRRIYRYHRHRDNNIATIAGGTGVTISGTATVANNTWRDFLCQITNTGTPAVTMTIMGSGVAT